MPFRYGRIQKDEVNQLAVENYFSLIERAEQFYQDQLDVVVQDMGQSQSFDVICLSGPSSSGKTTTAKTLKRKFISRGRNARVISLDDFYLDVDRTPHLPDGSPDFETIYALDIPRINQCIKELIDHKRTIIPVFDFQRRARALEEKEIVVGEDDVVIIEGIHGLNPLLTELAGERPQQICGPGGGNPLPQGHPPYAPPGAGRGHPQYAALPNHCHVGQCVRRRTAVH